MVLGLVVFRNQSDATLLSPYSLEVQSCELRSSSLKPLPGEGLSLAISDSSIGLRGKWKARKSSL